jgi:hypothetical protein
MQTKNQIKVGLGLALAGLMIGGVAKSAAQDVEAKGIFLDNSESRKTAVKFNVLLDREGRTKTVPSNYHFVNGDRMKFQFETNRDSYIYVLNRTVEGDPEKLDKYAGPMGIEVIRDDDSRKPEQANYKLLFPVQKSGSNNKIRGRKVSTLPTTESWFNMDENPGIEKLYIVVSPTPIEITRYFNVSGDVRRGRASGGGGHAGNGGGHKDDTDEDVLGQLNKDLLQYSRNAELTTSKGINVVDGYGIGIDSGKPMVVQVDLNHYRR